ncbi:MAG: InlB B-repeat-containing protein, partial [Propionibacteriaceae bacterium]|nr:InlB B-repeat-containing protein [Propionibacteriaceae bacterium]
SLTADEGVEIRQNFAMTGDGGGVWMGAGASADLSGSGRKILNNKAFGDGGGIWVAHRDLANLDVDADVCFMGNTASRLTTEIAPVDQPTYDAHVFTTLWSEEAAPATLGYNNYDIAYEAPWAVTFDEAGGSVVADQGVADGDSAAYPDPDSTRPGYTLAGWYEVLEDGDLSDDSYAFDTPVTRDIALQAVWDANTYTVSYLPGGGTGTMDDQTATYDAPLTLTANAFTRVGYTFAGWDANGDGVADYANQDWFERWQRTENLTLTALWNANGDTPYTVEHYYVDAAGNPSATPFKTESLTAATDSTATATPLAAGDAALVGYAYDPGFAATVGSGVVAGDGSLVLRLYYPVKTFTVTFVDGQGNTLKTETVAYGADATAPDDPSRTGYTFAGWDVAFTGVKADLTVTAQWTPIPVAEHTVTFVDGQGNTLKTQRVADGGAASAPPDPVRDGYTFGGWDKAFDKVTGDLTVTAQWTKNGDDNPPQDTHTNTSGTNNATGETLLNTVLQQDTTPTTDDNTGDTTEVDGTDDETDDDTDADDETTDDETTDDEDAEDDSASALTGGELSQANSLAALAAMLFAAGAVTLTAAIRRRWQP